MAVNAGACPNCGARIEFKAGASLQQVCAFCKHVVMRTDRDFRNLGRVADVVFSDVALSPGDRGSFRGRSFQVEGRLVLQHPAGGIWEEYYAIFDGRQPGWISEAQGKWHVVHPTDMPPPPPQALVVGQRVPFGQLAYVVVERNEATFLSGEGELPFVAAPGTRRMFVDLSGPNGAWASIDLGDGSTRPTVHLGVETTYDELGVQQHGGERPGAKIKTEGIKCPNCGAPLPVLAPGKSERAACAHCHALSDLQSLTVLEKQGSARNEPGIALGTKGLLHNVEWTVIGYVERSATVEGDWFGWAEYLLYEPRNGYRWLVYDEGKFWFVTPIGAGEVDTRSLPNQVGYRGNVYRKRNENAARVDYVVGEFYWKVQVGETVTAADFERGQELVNCERTADEANWSHSAFVPASIVARVFGWKDKRTAYGGSPQTTSGSVLTVIIVIVVILLVFGLMAAACSSCGGTGSSGGARGVGVSGGGFGGK